MDTNQRKVGRPKASPRTGPLVLGEDFARTKVTLEISERTAEVLTDYTRWVEKSAGISANEARFKTVDFALREIFRRDAVWQAERRAPSEPATAAAPVTAAPPPASRPAAAAPSSLPPPTPREPRANGDGNRI
jgi:hypothetical protein